MAMTLKEACKAYEDIMPWRKTTKDEAIGFLGRFQKVAGKATMVDDGLLDKAESYYIDKAKLVPKDGNGNPDWNNSNLKKIRKYLGGFMAWLHAEGQISRPPVFPVDGPTKAVRPTSEPRKTAAKKTVASPKSLKVIDKKTAAAPPPKSPQEKLAKPPKPSSAVVLAKAALPVAADRPWDEGLTDDQKILAQKTVYEVNDLANRAADSVLAIGRYILEKFFDDDPKKVESKSPTKGVSLRKLAQHPDIVLSLPALSRALTLAANEKLTIESVPTLEHLLPSHRLLIYRIEDKSKWKTYIERVVNERLSVKRLRVLLEKEGLISRSGVEPQETGDERRISRLERHIAPIKEFADFDPDVYLEELSRLPKDRFRTAAKDALEQMMEAKKILESLIGTLDKKLKSGG